MQYKRFSYYVLKWRVISKVQVFMSMHGESLSNGRKPDSQDILAQFTAASSRIKWG